MPPKQRRNNTTKGAVQRLRHEISGVGIKIRPDPPAVTLRPWSNVSVSVPYSPGSEQTPLPFTVSSLITSLKAQVGIGSTVSVETKFRELRVWGVPGGYLDVKIYDYMSTETTSPMLTEIRDVGNLSTRPKVGYVFPARLATAPISTSAKDVLIITSSPSTNTNITNELHLLVSYRIA